MLKKLYSIEILRCILMILIFLNHYPFSPVHLGNFSVCFFFILSGFTCSYGYVAKLSKETFSYKNYFISRIIKVYPLHWLLLPIAYYMHRSSFDQVFMYIPANILLIQSWIPVSNSYYSGNGVTWFLSTLIFMYIIFPFCFRFIKKFRIRSIFLFLFQLIILRVILEYLIPVDRHFDWLYITPWVRWIDFVIGIMTYFIWLSLYKEKKVNDLSSKFFCIRIFSLLSMAVLLYYAVILPMLFATIIRWIVFPIIIIMLVMKEYSVDNNCYSKKFFQFILIGGRISFSFYIIHQMIIVFLYNHFPINILNSEILKFMIILGVCIITAYYLNKYFEQPVYIFFKKYLLHG